jgi:hypothetical protein
VKPFVPVVPTAEEADQYGLRACALMLRMSKLGVAKALEAEISNPSWDDPSWCRMVVGLAAENLRETA